MGILPGVILPKLKAALGFLNVALTNALWVTSLYKNL